MDRERFVVLVLNSLEGGGRGRMFFFVFIGFFVVFCLVMVGGVGRVGVWRVFGSLVISIMTIYS